MTTATFSNGFTDTYKGKRDVKAAWMITDAKTGEVLNSGHSLDEIKARKTAEGNVRYTGLRPEGYDHGAADVPARLYAHLMPYLKRQMEARGLKGNPMQALKAWNKDYYAAQRAMVEIEVVAL